MSDITVNSAAVVDGSSFGLISQGAFLGYAEDIQVGTSDVSVPLFGIGLSSPSNIYDLAITTLGGGPTKFAINLNAPLPSGAGTLTANIKNVTTSTLLYSGGVTIASGSASGSINTSRLTINSGDQVVLLFKVSGSSVLIPQIFWSANS